MIQQSTATVYRGGRRRWLSLDAACRAEAKTRLKTHCDCDSGYSEYMDNGYEVPPYTCGYHQEGRYDKFVRRLAAIYKRTFLSGQAPKEG
jgi:hypothetical protein